MTSNSFESTLATTTSCEKKIHLNFKLIDYKSYYGHFIKNQVR